MSSLNERPREHENTAVQQLTLLAILAATLAASTGCARDLNKRFEFEHRRAATEYRIEGGYDLQNGRLVEALANYTEAIRIWPADAPSHWSIGRIWMSVGDSDRAAHAFALAVAYDESFKDRIPEPVPVKSREIMRALLESRPPPEDADWVAEDLR